ncbi:CheR family methyltransferase [uncultured Acetobacteroides sp.]|uniref:CheR family methyltransferase n=1 Tax=uncultured Acetobacteroides sp. TaxID=1760811 RepID=UPI0029F556A5|nr:CheR family methyltransferase [uncultured Acetobacteroides sp.]
MAAEIGIVETRNVFKLILDKQGYDFREYSITYLKRRLEHVLTLQGIRDTDSLMRKLEQDKSYFNQFLADFVPSTTEMFRDPSLWRYLKETILPELSKSISPIKIWIPTWDSGEDLFSLIITLKEADLLGRAKIFASTYSELITRNVKAGKVDQKKMETNEANYQRFQGKIIFSNYFTPSSDGSLQIKPELIRNVVFVEQNANFDSSVPGCNLILFRNQLIYMNISQEERVIGNLRDSLNTGGFLAIGIKENLEHLACGTSFINVNSSEKVYKRKIG